MISPPPPLVFLFLDELRWDLPLLSFWFASYCLGGRRLVGCDIISRGRLGRYWGSSRRRGIARNGSFLGALRVSLVLLLGLGVKRWMLMRS